MSEVVLVFFFFFSNMSKFDYKSKNSNHVTYYFVKIANFKRSGNLRIVFNVQENGLLGYSLHKLGAYMLQDCFAFWSLKYSESTL